MAQKFDLEEFLNSPSQEVFDSLLKDELITLGKHLDLEVKNSMKKDQTQDIILKHLVGLKLFNISLLESRLMPDVELRKLELQLELKKLEIQKEQELGERELQEKERDRLEREKERELRLEKQRLDHELELKKLELEEKLGPSHAGTRSSPNFDITRHIRLVPPFQEVEVDKYFLHFEKVAENLKWPKHYWTILLQSVTTRKARDLNTQLSVQQASDYDSVKQLILKGYELVPEAYRQRFRNLRKKVNKPIWNLLGQKSSYLIASVLHRRLKIIMVS